MLSGLRLGSPPPGDVERDRRRGGGDGERDIDGDRGHNA